MMISYPEKGGLLSRSKPIFLLKRNAGLYRVNNSILRGVQESGIHLIHTRRTKARLQTKIN